MRQPLLAALIVVSALAIRPVQAKLVDSYPMIVRADCDATIILVFEDEPQLATPEEVEVEYICADGLNAQGQALPSRVGEIVPARIAGNTVTITTHFRGETEHTVRVLQKGSDPKKPTVLGTAKLYSLKPDYFALRPYRGDVHMHSKFSDGNKEESPAWMVASCRKLGYDFAIVTDHHRYAGSLSAIDDFSKLPTDMKTFPGEEVHSPGNAVHVLSLGASESMTDWYKAKRDEYDAAVAAEKEKLPAGMPEDQKQPIAASFVLWDRIRAHGGVAGFAHPYWRPAHRQYIPTVVSDYLLQTARFDVMEVVDVDSTDLSILHYHELRAQGKQIAGIGVTDAHSSKRLGPGYTLILAETLDFPSLAKNLRLRHCAAVDVDPKSNRHTVIGEFRFSRYALFLLDHFYPKQEAICRQEGDWLLKALSGDTEARTALKDSQGTTPNLRVKYWQP